MKHIKSRGIFLFKKSLSGWESVVGVHFTHFEGLGGERGGREREERGEKEGEGRGEEGREEGRGE